MTSPRVTEQTRACIVRIASTVLPILAISFIVACSGRTPAISSPMAVAQGEAARAQLSIASGSAQSRAQSPTPTPTPTARPPAPTVAPSPTLSPTATPTAPVARRTRTTANRAKSASAPKIPSSTDAYVERPLSQLSPDAVAFLQGRAGPLGAVVIVPGQGTVYSYQGDTQVPLASVAKIITMVDVMDNSIKQGRPLTEQESDLLAQMIEESDNDAAAELWDGLGGFAQVQKFVDGLGLKDTQANPDDHWGATVSSPKDIGLVLAKLAQGEILNPSMRQQALELMSQVDTTQRWGVSAGLGPNQNIAIKDGWYPDDSGWWVNSAGIVLNQNKPVYILAVLTTRQESFDYGVATIEGVSGMVNKAVCTITGC